VPAARIGEGGLAVTVVTSPEEMRKIADYLELVSLKSLKAEVDLSRWRGRRLRGWQGGRDVTGMR